MTPRGVGRLLGRTKKRPLGERGGRYPVGEPNPPDPDVLPGSPLFAVLGTWMEEDIVEATVRNAFAQGAEAVYLVDNASTDATVDRAVAAGATLAESYRTKIYEERIRILLMNAVVARVSLASNLAHIWWLWMDADEFPEGPGGQTVADYVRTLDRRFRIVGSTYYNHFPTGSPGYVPGFHPIEFQPMCERFVPDEPRYCSQPHWKHPLQRFDADGPFLRTLEGFHSASVVRDVRLIEPMDGIITHHFQYREEMTTKKRMELLCGGPDRNAHNEVIGNSSIRKRFDNLDAVYAGHWDAVDSLRSHIPQLGVHLEAWPDASSARRWYPPGDLEAALASWRQDHESSTAR
ncbi:MAG TPA: glycosyltransferase family 2 protein [Acidimicrobiales bacterium]|nr:glycosyltransferase family 2 protein [Acidimicrobiales bacterium]